MRGVVQVTARVTVRVIYSHRYSYKGGHGYDRSCTCLMLYKGGHGYDGTYRVAMATMVVLAMKGTLQLFLPWRARYGYSPNHRYRFSDRYGYSY